MLFLLASTLCHWLVLEMSSLSCPCCLSCSLRLKHLFKYLFNLQFVLKSWMFYQKQFKQTSNVCTWANKNQTFFPATIMFCMLWTDHNKVKLKMYLHYLEIIFHNRSNNLGSKLPTSLIMVPIPFRDVAFSWGCHFFPVMRSMLCFNS